MKLCGIKKAKAKFASLCNVVVAQDNENTLDKPYCQNRGLKPSGKTTKHNRNGQKKASFGHN